jgi:hypothetical protein
MALQLEGIDPCKVNRGSCADARALAVFEPQTEGQKALHNSLLRQFNDFFEARSLGLFSVTAGIPPVMCRRLALLHRDDSLLSFRL